MAVAQTGEALTLIWKGLGQLVDSAVNNPTAPPPVAGPIGIASQVGDVFWQLGPVYTLYLAGILSANLALVNILPFPPLDGGRMLVLLLKAVAGERISIRAERLTYLVGFVFLMAFLVWISYFDITAPGPRPVTAAGCGPAAAPRRPSASTSAASSSAAPIRSSSSR